MLPVRPERTFRDLFDLFMADPSRTRVRKTDMVYATLFDMASGLWGAEGSEAQADIPLLLVGGWPPASFIAGQFSSQGFSLVGLDYGWSY